MNYICEMCGVQYGESIEPPDSCMICTEERQYINPNGQSWTTLEKMRDNGLKNIIQKEEKGLYSLRTEPSFAIGQTAFLIQSDGFNILWDCISYIDEATMKDIDRLGGIDAIALSHPHYYSSQVEWAETFKVPIYIHEGDKEWVMRPSNKIIYWSGESIALYNGVSLHRLGGHYKGGAILEWKNGNEQKGILLTGDIIQVVADRPWVSFMYSYPNLIPLPAVKVQEIANRVKQLKFDRLYNAFHNKIEEDAQNSVQMSAKRYIRALNGSLFNT
ncbi:hypothetical protein [Evansella tamaricis]|uniref:Metallo-beta-lactamase domain-containing protein n=1 Tax=Evansella tamaricis TaxID=2069301 RepID=A0ABS6JE31_9BACI|nr:hypothetical protein [Evansella tamaricis]MBU9711931.1 hypothetical protein [Evansella tamaricis]